MSDFLEVLFDPQEHTHESCIREVAGCDVVLLIVGGRFGGKGVPKAIDAASIAEVDGLTDEHKKQLSVTQLEVCKAISDGIPVYTFVQSNVWHDHHVYEVNKESPQIDDMRFPSIEKASTAKYIFEFINFLRHRSAGNSILSYSRIEEIEEAMRHQWSGLFQRMLRERRESIARDKHDETVLAEISDLRAAVMSALSVSGLREVAQGTRKFRLMLYFLRIANADHALLSNHSFATVLAESGVVRIEDIGAPRRSPDSRALGSAAVIYADGFIIANGFAYTVKNVERYAEQWDEWKRLTEEAKSAIADTLLGDTFRHREKIEGDYTQYRKRLANEEAELAQTVSCVEVRRDSLEFGLKTYEARGGRVVVSDQDEQLVEEAGESDLKAKSTEPANGDKTRS